MSNPQACHLITAHQIAYIEDQIAPYVNTRARVSSPFLMIYHLTLGWRHVEARDAAISHWT